ncbi:MAG: DUF4003 family protein [Ruminococcus sp.]|nr:DUF4003 family protein [Ruminococcus sp.]
MTEVVKRKCELLVQNKIAISKKFMLEKAMMSMAAALIFTGEDKEADVEKMAECRKILSKHTGVFSEYRDTVKLALLSEMSLSEDPEKYIDDVKDIYKKLNKGNLTDNSNMVLAAMLICDLGRQDSTDKIIEKYNEIMKRMNKEHPILTDSSDISFVILLALSDKSIDSIIDDLNECYSYLKKECKVRADSDSIQGISEILALSDGEIKEKCDTVVKISEALKGNYSDIESGYAFTALGALIGIDETAEVLAGDIIGAEEFLKSSKGFSENTIEKKHRLMFAVLLVAESYGTSSSMINNTFISSAFGIIKAKQIATMITIISNVLPGILGAVVDKKTTEDEAPQSEHKEEN